MSHRIAADPEAARLSRSASARPLLARGSQACGPDQNRDGETVSDEPAHSPARRSSLKPLPSPRRDLWLWNNCSCSTGDEQPPLGLLRVGEVFSSRLTGRWCLLRSRSLEWEAMASLLPALRGVFRVISRPEGPDSAAMDAQADHCRSSPGGTAQPCTMAWPGVRNDPPLAGTSCEGLVIGAASHWRRKEWARVH